MKQRYILWIFIILLLPFRAYPINTPDEVRMAAETGLPEMLNAIPEGFESYYGFKNREEFDNAYIAEAYQLCTISPEKLNMAYQGNHYIDALKVWRFPVICAGQTRSLLTVAQINGEWKAVEIGAAGLAAEFNDLEKNFSQANKSKARVLLRLFQLESDYLVLVRPARAVEDGIFYPLRSAVRSLGIAQPPSEGLSFGEVLSLLQEKYERKKDFLSEQNR